MGVLLGLLCITLLLIFLFWRDDLLGRTFFKLLLLTHNLLLTFILMDRFLHDSPMIMSKHAWIHLLKLSLLRRIIEEVSLFLSWAHTPKSSLWAHSSMKAFYLKFPILKVKLLYEFLKLVPTFTHKLLGLFFGHRATVVVFWLLEIREKQDKYLLNISRYLD